MSELSDNTNELKTDQDISSNNIADGYSLTGKQTCEQVLIALNLS